MTYIDVSKYYIDKYPKFDPRTIKPNSVINILGDKLAGKNTLQIDLIYKIIAHRNIIIGHNASSLYESRLEKNMKKRYNRYLPICEFKFYKSNHHIIHQRGVFNRANDDLFDNIDKILEKSKTSDKNIFLFHNINGINKIDDMDRLKNLTEKNYFINMNQILLSSYKYYINNILKKIHESDYVFIFNSYGNNYCLSELEKINKENSNIINVDNDNKELCGEISLEDSILALLSTVNVDNYICLVIDNTIESNNILDKIFWYKAEINLHLKFKNVCNKIGEWFLECKFNPKYKYCRTRLEKEFHDIYDDNY